MYSRPFLRRTARTCCYLDAEKGLCKCDQIRRNVAICAKKNSLGDFFQEFALCWAIFWANFCSLQVILSILSAIGRIFLEWRRIFVQNILSHWTLYLTIFSLFHLQSFARRIVARWRPALLWRQRVLAPQGVEGGLEGGRQLVAVEDLWGQAPVQWQARGIGHKRFRWLVFIPFIHLWKGGCVAER